MRFSPHAPRPPQGQPSNAEEHRRRRKPYAAARAFYLTILILTVFAAWSFVAPVGVRHSQIDVAQRLTRRSPITVARRDEEVSKNSPHTSVATLTDSDRQCRLVHSAEDQCAFVRANCPDEEAGLFSYLQLYYCKMPTAKPVAFAIMVIWLGLLFSTIGIAASDFFCIDLSTIASILGMSESMAGVTFLAFGNGSPDVFSTFAAMKTHSGSLAVGELIGAAGFITSVVAGSMALVRPFKVAKKSFLRDVGFFIIAAAFSMIFLADGHLDLWECAVMVGFYVFYVMIVVIWHWVLKRRLNRRRLEETARSHFHTPGAEQDDVEPYRDDVDEETGTMSRGSRPISVKDFSLLERASSPHPRPLDEQAEADDETRDRYMAEISGNMRVNRRTRAERRSTMNPIRPSLVGALEFRAVLSSLNRSRSIQPIPITLRRYSDDPNLTLSQQGLLPTSISTPDVRRQAPTRTLSGAVPAISSEQYRTTRTRAKSANDAAPSSEELDNGQRPSVPQIGLTTDFAQDERRGVPTGAVQQERSPTSDGASSPKLLVPHAKEDFGYLASSPVPISPMDHLHPHDHLAPPEHQSTGSTDRQYRRSPIEPSSDSLGYPSRLEAKPTVPRLEIPHSAGTSQRSSPLSPFPMYHDDPNFVPTASPAASLHLPPPSVSPEPSLHPHLYDTLHSTPLRWWPYKVLPSPGIVVSTLFPTLYSWNNKNIWEKMLGVVSAPSVFFLAITLPVVELDKDEDEDDDILEIISPDNDPPALEAPLLHSRANTLVALPPESPTEALSERTGSNSQSARGRNRSDVHSPAINITPAPDQDIDDASPPKFVRKDSSGTLPMVVDDSPPSSFKEWNRWLVIIQAFMAPLFTVLIVHVNMNPDEPRKLILPVLIVLIGSLTVTALLLLLTTPERPPRLRYLLCFVGFAVSVAWISTIAGEVVGVLKALGIILNISDAILGLTIFAVGNSLGDLVADITVARLGYPVMALSACFGGPMLNILLGIGLSGLYMTIHGEEHRHAKHPTWPVKYKPYAIEVGGTLLISGVALLVTLLGLLIVVPLRGWWMDRRVGYGLLTLWTLSTLGNVIVEVVGVGKER